MKHRILKIAAVTTLTLSLLILPVAAADMGNMNDTRVLQNFFAPGPRSGENMMNDPGASDPMSPSGENGAGMDGSQNNGGGMGNSGGMNGSGDMSGSSDMGGSGSSDGMFDTTDGNLGDTSGPTESGDGVIDGTADSNLSPMSDMEDTAGDTAGTTDDTGSSVLGIIITLLLIGAVVVLIFALIPKKKS